MTITDRERWAGFSGELLTSASPGYDQARRLWNGMLDRRPEIIARCEDVGDVVTAVDYARANGLRVSIRGGGHNVAGTAVVDAALVIDLSAMTDVDVDPVARRARAQGGATWADVDRATQTYALAAPGGLVSETGIAGLTLGGGLGWLRRRDGLTCDNLVAAEVVTSNGHVVVASEDQHGDLLWALRGGGGGCGVVTQFEYRLQPAGPEVSAAIVYYDGDQARPVIRAFREFTADCPDEISALCMLGIVPEADTFPEESWGRPTVIIVACHCGEVDRGANELQPLRVLAEPIVDFSDTITYLDLQTLFDEDYPSGELRYYWTSAYVDHLDDEVIELLIRHARRQPSTLSTVDIWQLGGAIGRVGPNATAFSHRDATFMIGIEANWSSADDDNANLKWARTLAADLRGRVREGTYLNFPGFFENENELRRGALRDNYERLTSIQQTYDPVGLFRR